MELALQVVGLKMTGRIEEAKSVAMRIVGTNTNMDMSSSTMTSSNGGGNSMAFSRALRAGALDESTVAHSVHHSPATSRSSQSLASMANPVAAALNNRSRDFQSVIIEFLALLDVDLDANESTSTVTASQAVSYCNPSGQTLLHLAAILGFHRLITALVGLGIDLDARDMSGYTALHFAASCGRLACARVLLEGGADIEVVDGRGRSARQLAQDKDQSDLVTLLENAEAGASRSHRRSLRFQLDSAEEDAGADDELDSEDEDEESLDEDEDAEVSNVPVGPTRGDGRRVTIQPSPRFYDLDSSHSSGPDLYSSQDEAELEDPLPQLIDAGRLHNPHPHIPTNDVDLNEKPPIGWIHRTLAQLQPPPKGNVGGAWALPNLPNLPNIPQLPNLPNIPIHIPDLNIMAFPYAVQMPTWPAALQWQQLPGTEGGEKSIFRPADLASWRAWYEAGPAGWWSEKQFLMGPPRAQPATDSVPMFMPSEAEDTYVDSDTPTLTNEQSLQTPGSGSSKALVRTKIARRMGYEPEQVTDREVQAYTYYSKKMRKLKRKSLA